MFVLIIRCTIIYFLLLLIVRLMGKRQLSELQPFELVITLIIAELAILPMQETGMPILNGIVPLLTLAFLHYVISFIAQKSIILRKFIGGTPVVLISPSGIEFKNLKKLNMNINDLIEALRSAGHFDLENVEYAILESNGKISILPKATAKPLTPSDLKLTPKKNGIFMVLISDGKILKNNLKIMQIKESFLTKQLKKAGVNNLSDILIATINKQGKMYIQQKNQKYVILQTNKKGGEVK